MIITLVGADFKDSNIGTLSTWTISRVLGNGATYSGATYVDKNARLDATVTIDEGYEVGTAGVTVTMGGVPVTSGVSTSGNVITISITSVTGNVVIKVPTKNTSTGDEDGGNEDEGSGGTPTVPDTLTLLSKNGSGVTTFSRLAKNAYVANMKQMFSAGSTIGYIEIPLVSSKTLTTSQTTIPEFNLWVFNADTNTPIEKVISAQSYTSQSSDTFGCQAIKVDVNRSFDYPFYFGYSNMTSANDTAIAYYSESNNYLSGTEFTIDSAIAVTSGSVAIYCAIYGEGSSYTPVIPDDVNGLTQIAYYNKNASSIMAGNCYVAASTDTVPANTKITTLDIKAGSGAVEGLNVYVVNAENNTIIEMLQDETTVNTVYSSRIDSDVVRLNVDKTYTHPIYFMFNAERTGSNKVGLKMQSGGSSSSILLTDDETKPAVGDVLSGFKSGYGIGHAIYS